MDTDAKGQLGGMDASEEVRRRLAGQSRGWRCGVCGKTNEEIMREQEELVEEKGEAGRKEEVVPEGLRLAYREDLNGVGKDAGEGKLGSDSVGAPTEPGASTPATVANGEPPTRSEDAQPQRAAPQPAQAQQRRNEDVPAWIDKAIYSVVALLIFLVWKKLGS